MIKTPQVQGREAEVRMARERGARLHPNSGAGRIKDDASDEDTLYEFKHVEKSHTLHGSALHALLRRGIQMQKDVRYVVEFGEYDLTATITLQKGHHHV